MTGIFCDEAITPGPVSNSSGHEVCLHAIYNPPQKNGSPYRIVYKKNKHGRAELSCLEVLFSQLTRLFLVPDLTPTHHLVVDKNQCVVGLAVQHLSSVIADKEGLDHSFYTIEEPQQPGCVLSALAVDDPIQIPIYFLNRLPQGFYAKLVQAESEGVVTIDYESLASIFTTSYSLEEDDLHKGNFGFYMVEKHGKPRAVFFKIDHDLMFVDSIMGFHTSRPLHLFHGAHAFDITAEDLLSLVSLKNSCNFYWPTKFGYLVNPLDMKKEYHSDADIHAFAQLGGNPAFIKAKWRSFYKHILISTQLIEQTLKESIDRDKAADRAQIALVTQALTARLARLRAVLFSIKEFRDFIASLNEQDRNAMIEEIISSGCHSNELVQEVQESMACYQKRCTSMDEFDAGDTPLHTAIKLGEYRYEETFGMFGEFIDVKNNAGKTPLDIALEQVHPECEVQDLRRNPYLIMKHLLDKGAQQTNGYQRSEVHLKVSDSRYPNPYLNQITTNMDYQHLKHVLVKIGEDHRFCLKFQKNLAIECIKHFIQHNKNHPNFRSQLVQLRNDVNGSASEEESAGLKYIRQLRSNLWIIRQIRGLYGWTSTQWEINSIIHRALTDIKVQEPGCFSLFSKTGDRDDSNDELSFSDHPALVC